MYIIGRGGYGKVYKVREKVTGKCYALKQMTKAKIIAEGSEVSVIRERIFLAKLHSPFIVNMLLSFQNKNNLFLLMELLTGGDLRYHLLNYNFFFTETQIKFLMTNIILSLEYIHHKGIVHRDLKPENIMLNTQGYAKLTDFGISCLKKKLDFKDDSGTPAYMAPETMIGEKQDYSVDYYSLGVIGYELLKGRVPYDANDREEILDLMSNDVINLKNDEKLKSNYSEFCLDFINKLLKRKPSERIGYKDGEYELKKHSFFTGIDWDSINKMKYKSPLFDIIQYSKIKHGYVKELFDTDYCNKPESLNPKMGRLYKKIIDSEEYSLYFRYYTCICVENILREFKKDAKAKKKKDKKMKRSQSTNDINNSGNKYNIAYDNSEMPNSNLPVIIKNPTEIYHQNREKKLKDYYKHKLFKYKNEVDKLKKNYLLKRYQLNRIKYPALFQFSQFPMNNYGFFPNYNQIPNKNFLPLINQNRNNYMDNFMTSFLKKMSEDRDNFFMKNNMNNIFGKNNDDEDDDYYNSIDSDEEQYRLKNYYKNPYYNDPFFSNYNYINPYWYNQSEKEKEKMKEKNIKRNKGRYNTRRRSRLIKEEETPSENEQSKEEDEEDEK